MPNINLIAVRRAEKKRLERNTRQLFFALAAEVGALVLLGSYLGAQRLGQNAQMDEARTQMTRLQPTLDRIENLEKEIGTLRPKVNTLRQAKEDTLRWRALMQVVAESVPSASWLSNLTSARTDDDTTITLSGTAGSQSLVGETMTRLTGYSLFDKVELHYTQLAASNGKASGANDAPQSAAIAYEIGAHLRPLHPEKKSDSAAGAAAGTQQTASGETKGNGNA